MCSCGLISYDDTESKDYPYLVALPVHITFDANHGSSETTSQDIPENIEYILTANSFDAPSGKTFTGWNTLANPTETTPGTAYDDGARITLGNDITLYAQWVDTEATPPIISGITTPTGCIKYGSEGNISVTAAPATDTEYNLTYQWYSNTTQTNSGGTAISGANALNYKIPAGQNAGTYYYYCVVTATRADNGKTAQTVSDLTTVTINKAASTSANVKANDIICDTTEQPLITVTGSASGGIMHYALSDTEPDSNSSAWKTDIPTAADAGTYTVWYKVVGDSNHNDTEPVSITVKISDATPAIQDANMTVSKGQTQTLEIKDSTGTGSREWSLDSSLEWVSLVKDSDGQATLTAAPDFEVAGGEYNCTVTVRNSDDNSSQAVITITVKSSVNDGDSEITEGTYTGKPASEDTTITDDGQSVTSTLTEFKSGSTTILATEIAITTESTDLTGIAGVKFNTVISIDVSIDIIDTDFKNYGYSLDITGLPDGLNLSGDIAKSDEIKSSFLHIFEITGTPAKSAD